MNLADIRKKLDTLNGEELEKAEKLLSALGIVAKKKSAARKNFCTKLQPYYERIIIRCETCNRVHFRYMRYYVCKKDGQYFLTAGKIHMCQYGQIADIILKERRTGQMTCHLCKEELVKWSQQELVNTLLNVRNGGKYAKITTEELPNRTTLDR